jgi:PleD family two-component response regulator
MQHIPRQTKLPLILIGSAQEWSARSLESVFAPEEYEVHRMGSGRAVLADARATRPDLVILDQNLADIDAAAVSRALRDDPKIGPTTPIVIVTAATTIDRAERLLALDAGAWDVLSLPLEGDMLLVRMRNFLLAKQESDRVRDGILVDAGTGTYNRLGLELLGRELGADAGRTHEPFACVAVKLDYVVESGRTANAPPDPGQQAEYLAAMLKQRGRVSDVVGRVEEDEFAMLLPFTSDSGVRHLFDRLQAMIADVPPTWTGSGRKVRLCGGYSLAHDPRPQIDVSALLNQAQQALRADRSKRSESPLLRYGEDSPLTS